MMGEKASIWSHYIRQRESLLRFLTRRTRDPDVAQDLLQETWLRIADGDGAMSIDNPRAYLFQVASNLAIDYFRAEGRRLLRRQEVEVLLSVPDDQPGLKP